MAERDGVIVYKCWGCNRLRIPKPWTPATLALLRSEGRLRFREYLCAHEDCGANAIAGVRRRMSCARCQAGAHVLCRGACGCGLDGCQTPRIAVSRTRRTESGLRRAGDTTKRSEVVYGLAPASVVAACAAAFGITVAELVSPSRVQPVLVARQCAMFVVRDVCGLSFPQVGRLFGRDHSTVMHACGMTVRRLERDTGLARLVDGIVAALLDGSDIPRDWARQPELSCAGCAALAVRVATLERFLRSYAAVPPPERGNGMNGNVDLTGTVSQRDVI